MPSIMCMLCSIDLATVGMVAPIAQATIISAPILLRGQIQRGARQILRRRAGEATEPDEAAQGNDRPAATDADPMDAPDELAASPRR
jgi:hypothetical protein